MKRFLAGVVLGLSLQALWVWAEDITVTSYFPSPRGIFQEVRAGQYRGLKETDAFGLDADKGELSVSEVRFQDKKTGEWLGLGYQNGQVILTDFAKKHGYVIYDISNQSPGAVSAPAPEKPKGQIRVIR